MSGFRVCFRHKCSQLCETREDAEALFAEEPSAYQIDRWDAEIRAWGTLTIRDSLGTKWSIVR